MPNPLSSFSRHVFLAVVWLALVVLVFMAYVYAEKNIDVQNSLRYNAFKLAQELQQTAEDLTKKARSYVQTGRPHFKQHYQEILDIRNGLKPRPLHYHGVYWALMTDGSSHADMPKGEAIALESLMQQHDLTAKELEKLHQAKQSSDAVTKIEQAAMRLVEGDAVSRATRQQAMDMLYDATYTQAKLSIMRQIDAFYGLVDTRTQKAVDKAIHKAFLLRVILVLFVVVQLWWIWGIYRSLNRTLGADVDTLHNYIMQMGDEGLQTTSALSETSSASVMHWLAETQQSLLKTQQEERQARLYNERITQLYAALSQCNQAIARCVDDNALFHHLCEIAVTFGGMKMAWIGLVDESKQCLIPVAVYGEGVDYVAGLHISTDANQLTSKGPIGQAVLNDKPFWCQDFVNDPNTAIWHDLGKHYGWGAVASLPLHRQGKVIGAFSLYSGSAQAFDIEAKKLLVEMASDIDFALDRFAVDAEREHFRVNLQSSKEHARLVLENAMDAVINMNTEGVVTEWSGAAEKIFGYTRAEAMGQILGDLIVPEVYREAHSNGMKRLLASEDGESKFVGNLMEWIAKRRDGVEIPIELSIAHIKDGSVQFFSAFIREISDRKSSEQHIQFLANYDALTGLPNRNQLNERAKYAISLAHRNHNNLAIMFLDLDHFKDVNDTLGHSIGDQLLVELANRIISVLRQEDTVSRFGGDEFIFLLPNVNEEGAAVVAQKLMAVIASPVVIEDHHLSVTASIGIAMYPDDGLEMETLLRNADVAMYKAKEDNRSGYRFYTAAMQTQSARNLLLVNALRQAIALNQLTVYYQPQIALKTRQVIGVEALLRWQHPELGEISPAEFIPIAESSGMIVCIGEWVLMQAARQAKLWLDQGILNATMAVNLSVVQFRDPELPNMVMRVLAQEGLPAHYLELELTEGVALEDPERAIRTMDALHAHGVKLSIDDFGTGYSSLSHLKKFRAYKLKIDRSFVRDITTDEEDKAIVMAIIQLAKSLGLNTIAEGVETPEQLAFLQAQGCDEVQGFLFSKALPVPELEAFIAKMHGLD